MDYYAKYGNYIKFLQQEAQSLETYYTFFITGSTAIILYLNELYTVDKDSLSIDEQSKLFDILNEIAKPDDLDLFYARSRFDDQDIFYDKKNEIMEKERTKEVSNNSNSTLFLNLSCIKTSCGQYININVFRESANFIRKEALFEKKEDVDNIFTKIDIKDLKYSDKINPYKISNIGDCKVLGLTNLIELYKLVDNNNKMNILEFVKSCINKSSYLQNKYN